jgi:putative transcriptional regulator
MKTITVIALLLGGLPPANAADVPAKGRFLVATEDVRGSGFESSVILLLQYDDSGAAGLIVNQPMDAEARDVLPELEELQEFDGKLYFGGPVGLDSIQALSRFGSTPDRASHIVDDIYIVPIDENTVQDHAGAGSLRIFVGYAGWAAGQLEGEMLRGSWRVVPATAEDVFATDPERLWHKLSPPETLRASNDD